MQTLIGNRMHLGPARQTFDNAPPAPVAAHAPVPVPAPAPQPLTTCVSPENANGVKVPATKLEMEEWVDVAGNESPIMEMEKPGNILLYLYHL